MPILLSNSGSNVFYSTVELKIPRLMNYYGLEQVRYTSIRGYSHSSIELIILITILQKVTLKRCNIFVTTP